MRAIVGREEELAAVAAFLDEPGGAASLVLEGEAGSGKTTLWFAGTALAAGRGRRVLAAHAAEAEATLSFTGLGDLLDGALDDVRPALPPPQRRALEIALLLEQPAGPPPDRRAVAVAFLSALRALASDAPVLVAVDDVQWLDGPSADVLAFAARRLQDEPVAFLLALRVGDPRREPLDVERALPRLRRVGVGPLGLDDLERLLRERLGLVLPRPGLRELHGHAGGNPLYALELARAPGRGPELPPTLRALVHDRLLGLPEEARAVLAAAAALADPALDRLDAAVGAAAVEALRPAVAAEVVELEGGRARFAHPLLASGAYGLLDAAERRDLHVRLADVVAEPEERARHLALAAVGPDAAVAAALEQAAALARRRGAPAAAADLAERAAALTPPDAHADARRRLAAAAWHHFASGDARRARSMLEALAAELAPGVERARVLYALGRIRSYDDDLAAALALHEQAIAEAGGDADVGARAHEGASAALFRLRTRFSEAVDHATEAARLAREAGDGALLAEALGAKLLSEAALGREEAERTLPQALAGQEAAADERAVSQPLFQAAVVWLWREEAGRARDAFDELLARARERGDESSAPYALVLRSQAECVLGELAAAATSADEAAALAGQVGQETLLAYALSVRALADAHRGRADEARAAADRALELAARTSGVPAYHFATSALGLLELSLGRADEAAARLGPLVARARDEEMCEPGLTRFARDHAEALVALGRLDEAEELLAWCEAHAARLGRRGALAVSLRGRGLLAAARGNHDEALATLARAVAAHDGSPLRFDRARTLLAHGAALRRARRKRDARVALEAARAELEEMDAAVYAAQARAELAKIGGRVAADELTATERHVAELVARGMTNREVAAAMYLTTKTIEFHLRNVFRKLDVRSRTELARRLPQG